MGRRLPAMVDGSDMSLDTAMYIQSEGGERILVPIRPDVPDQTNVPTEPDPDPVQEINHDYQHPTDVDMNHNEYVPPQKKNRWFYMKEFVARVGGILEAIQAREAMPDLTKCAECNNSIAHWRCEDCAERKLLCRVCMWHSHFSNPFHRIKCWTGTHFRNAALWEVGVYLLLPHQDGGLCQNLSWQRQMLEKFQIKKNVFTPHSSEDPSDIHVSEETNPEPDFEREAAQEEAEMQFLDQLHCETQRVGKNNP